MIIPPNPPNIKEFEDLFGSKAEIIREAQGTKYTEKLEVSKKSGKAIKKGKFFEDGYKAVEKGYGKMFAKGLNYSDTEVTVSSEENAPLKRTFANNKKDDLSFIYEFGKSHINNILIKLKNNGLNNKKE